jgi:ABC-type amino acid transport substrate-binding protein/ABC-type amino acid transport system permease subunit
MHKLGFLKAFIRPLCKLLLVPLCILLTPSQAVWAQEYSTPDEALTTLLEAARSDCKSKDLLNKVLCEKRIRFGVNPSYAGFSVRTDGQWAGYQVDIALRIAAKLGVEAVFVAVSGADRIGALADGRVDVVLATLGHTTLRDAQVNFVRPHYYASMTEIVGARDLRIVDWEQLVGRTVCVTVGSYQNAGLIGHGARLMLFDGSAKLEEALNSGVCEIAAHDDSYLAGLYRKLAFDKKFDTKFRFAPVPWGAAVPRDHANDLALALSLYIQMMHRDGTLVALAQANHINSQFLEQARATWNSDSCNRSTGSKMPGCTFPPLDDILAPTSFATATKELESWFSQYTGVDISLPWLTTMSAWELFKTGIVYTFVLLIGSLAATLLIACLFGRALSSPFRVLRWATQLLIVTAQSTPFVLGLVIGLALATAFMTYSVGLGIAVCMLVAGLMNGANAGQSIAESVISIIHERGDNPSGLFVEALRRSRIQLQASLVNASKGVPAASFIGAPELLSSMTDISSFSASRVSTYLFLILFYMLIVAAVVWLCGKAGERLERGGSSTESRHV